MLFDKAVPLLGTYPPDIPWGGPCHQRHLSTLLRAELTIALSGSVSQAPWPCISHPSIQTGQSVSQLDVQIQWVIQGATPRVDMEQCSGSSSGKDL